jgi:4-methylaminobutanoate oxidase (formaldehyde-forming)
MNSSGIALAAAAGRLTAEWIVDGRPSLDATKLDLRRFAPVQAARRYLRLRIPELPAFMCGTVAPGGEFTTARGLGRSPLHDFLAARGAVFTTSAAMEQPAWFGDPGDAMAAYRREAKTLAGGIGLVDPPAMPSSGCTGRAPMA